jgi:hypothetical protein
MHGEDVAREEGREVTDGEDDDWWRGGRS